MRLLFFMSNKSYLHLRKEDFINDNESIAIRNESENEKFKDGNLVTNADEVIDKQFIYKSNKKKGKF